MGVHDSHEGTYRLCQHPDCRDYRARYTKRWQHERHQGKKRTTDTTRVRLHIATLIGAGWSIRSIAGEAGISPSGISRIARGTQLTVTRRVETAVLALRPGAQLATTTAGRSEPFVPRVGTVRRIQALLWMGWGHDHLTTRGGIATRTLLHQKGQWVTRTSHDKIAALYDELAMTPGPSSKARTYARQLGYLPPLAWDDIDHDPIPYQGAATVDEHDEAVVIRFMDGERDLPITTPDRFEIVRRFLEQGRPLAELERLGWRPSRYLPAGQDVA